MSESQVNQTLSKQKSSVAGSTPRDIKPPMPPATTPNITVMPGDGASVTNDPVQFDSANIGVQTAKKQDLFAEQNRLASEKKQKSNKARKKLFVILGTVFGLFVISLAVWLIVVMIRSSGGSGSEETARLEPTIVDASDEGIIKMRELAQSEYNSNKDINKINQLFADEAAVTNSEYLNQLRLAQILFYVGNGFYQQSADLSSEVDADSLPLVQKGTFYDAMYSTYNGLNDSIKAGEYFALSFDVQVEIQGYDEGDDDRDGI